MIFVSQNAGINLDKVSVVTQSGPDYDKTDEDGYVITFHMDSGQTFKVGFESAEEREDIFEYLMDSWTADMQCDECDCEDCEEEEDDYVQ